MNVTGKRKITTSHAPYLTSYPRRMHKPRPPILVSRKVRVADKPEMGFEAGPSEGFAQTGNAARNAAGPGIPIRAFKAQYVKLRV
jgi:hypothetical protein